MKTFFPILAATLAIAGCASSTPVPVEDAVAAPLVSEAAKIEQDLQNENGSDYDCQVAPDSAIVCDGVRQRVN